MKASVRAVSWLDWKLGARLLVKYPALTIIAGLALAATVAIGSVGIAAPGGGPAIVLL